MVVSQKIKVESPYDAPTLLVNIHPNGLKAGFQAGFGASVFSAALFTTAERQKQPKCPLMDARIKTVMSPYDGARFNSKQEGNSKHG